MKHIYLSLITFVLFGYSIVAAQTIPNAGFESWIQVGDDYYPEFWEVSDSNDVKDGYIERSTDSKSETYAVKFNTYQRSYAPNVEIYRSFSGTDRPDSLQFSVKVAELVNTNSDGAIVDIYFYDQNEDFVRDISIRVNNNTDWRVVTRALGDLSGIDYYKINLYLVDFSRSASTYAIFDEIKFITNDPSSVRDLTEAIGIIDVYPNPSSNGWFELNSEQNVSGYEVIDPAGKVISVQEGTNIRNVDLTSMAPGVYTIRFMLDNTTTVFRRVRVL